MDQIGYDKIVMVNGFIYTDQISLDYIDSIRKRHKAYNNLLYFLRKKGYDSSSKEINLTFGEFWEHQIQKFKSEKTKKTKLSQSKPTTYKLENQSKILEFFKKHDKKKEYESFLSSIPNNTKIIISINRLSNILIKIIDGGETPIEEDFYGNKLNLDIGVQYKWKSDMVHFLHMFSSDIYELNSSNIYKDEILKPNTFLYTLFNIEESGVGKGEVLLSYLFKNSEISGGSKPFDISLNNIDEWNIIIGSKRYEVKNYSSSASMPIRLGEGGRLTQFEFFNIIQETIIRCKRVHSEHPNQLRGICGPILFSIWENMIDDNEHDPKEINRAIMLGVRKGEINNTHINDIKMFYFLMHELTTNNIDKRDYLYNEIHDFRKIKYINHPDLFQKDLNRSIEIYFDNHVGLDAFIVFRPNKINIVGKHDMVYKNISQFGVRFIEKELYDEKSDLGIKMLNAFYRWKEEINKIKGVSFYEFYVKELIKENKKS